MRLLRVALVSVFGVLAACSGQAAGGGGGVDGPPEARVVDGKPVGLFFMTRFWAFNGSLEKSVWYFAPDGRVYQNLDTGFSAADLQAHKGAHGTYGVAGDQLKVTWSDGTVTESGIEPDATGFAWNGGIFTAVKPFTDPKAVAGTYEGGESLSSGANSAIASNTLRLDADGTFTSAGIASVESETSESHLSSASQGGSTGTWKIEGYSLVLTYADGNTVRSMAFPYDDAETPVYPDRLFVGGTMYARQ